MSTIDIQISGIDHDRNGNLVGLFVAFRDNVLVAESGRQRRQIHGGYRASTQTWLASHDIVTDDREGGVYWTRQNARGRVVDVRACLMEVR